MIPYGRQSISNEDIEAVVAVLKSDFLTQGPQINRFEDAISSYCGVNNVIAVNSATSALHIACLALGAGPGDSVWTSPNTFVASANCARYCGASVDFVDINPNTLNMCSNALAEKLQAAEKNGTLPKIVIPVHFAGLPCDMAHIHKLAEKFGFYVIEDASHAIGARYKETIIGNCRYSDITVFSFHPVKIITSAEGGAATTRSPKLARKMKLLRSHGITRDKQELDHKNIGPWYYEQQFLGYNYRMTDIQAALGVSQMTMLDAWISRRHEIREYYERNLVDCDIILPAIQSDSHSALHLYPIQVPNRRVVFEKLRESGVGVNVHYIPVHTQSDFKQFGFDWGDFPNSEHYYQHALSLPMYGTLSDEQLDDVISKVRDAIT